MTGRLLLDTCAVIWIALDQAINAKTKLAINAEWAENQNVCISPISAWELGLLSAKGRFPTTKPPIALFNEIVATRGIKIEALSPEILVESSFLPGEIHGDPADRIIIATARKHDLIIVTRDKAILDYGAAGHVRTLNC